MADQRRVFDVAHALAVVVDDGHLAAFFQYLSALHQTQLVCIHDDTERSLGNDGQGAFGVDEVVLLPCRDEGVDEAARQGGVTAHGDEPMASRSLIRWPMMTTWSASLMSLTSWSATMRLRTLLRFSTPWLTPP